MAASAGVTQVIYQSPAPPNAALDVKTDQGTSLSFDVSSSERLNIFVNLTALAGGTTPNVKFKYEEQDSFGTWYQVGYVKFAGSTAPEALLASFGPGTGFNATIGRRGRIKWEVTGAPTTATANITVQGEPIT